MGKYKTIDLRKIKLELTAVLIFAVYLLLLPRLAHFATPCLSRYDVAVTEYENCNLILALDRFMIFAFAGMLILNIGLLSFKKVARKRLIILNIVLAVLIIISYYAYIPYAWNSIKTSEVYLDTMYKSQK